MYLCHEADKISFSDFLNVFIRFPQEHISIHWGAEEAIPYRCKVGQGFGLWEKKKIWLLWKVDIYLWVKSPFSEADALHLCPDSSHYGESGHCQSSLWPSGSFKWKEILPLATRCLEQLQGNLHSNIPPYPLLEGKQVRAQVMSAQGSGGGSLRQWQVLKAGALAVYQETSTTAGRAFQAMQIVSKGEGSACVKPWSFFTLCEARVSGCPKLDKDTVLPTIPETGFHLSTSMRHSRSRLLIMVNTYCGALNKRTYYVFSHSWSMCTLKACCKSYSTMSTWHQPIEGMKYFLLSAAPGLVLNAFLQGYG